ncbi:ATP-dependent zinc metalloprotease FTSH 6, chloroplastic [Iris pallida]|uniref:ATP-dependent zinc metalloprotease FTSH 6, chloroplastic n=1 Tax=Iris pallida TaxID=29817 RepID=A0AAX6F6Y1_IRIPA|nr:ATP-dependent zinc metalloprotease FTSH 6, chloroplastic [Iris pallida]
MATVPFSNRSTFLTAPSFRYSRNLEYDIRLDVDSSGLSGLALAGWTGHSPAARRPRLEVLISFLLVSMAFEGLGIGLSLVGTLLWFSW